MSTLRNPDPSSCFFDFGSAEKKKSTRRTSWPLRAVVTGAESREILKEIHGCKSLIVMHRLHRHHRLTIIRSVDSKTWQVYKWLTLDIYNSNWRVSFFTDRSFEKNGMRRNWLIAGSWILMAGVVLKVFKWWPRHNLWMSLVKTWHYTSLCNVLLLSFETFHVSNDW